MDTLLPVYVNPDTLLETSGGILPEKTRGGLPR